MNICQQCEAEVKEGNLFCSNCGARIEDTTISKGKFTNDISEPSEVEASVEEDAAEASAAEKFTSESTYNEQVNNEKTAAEQVAATEVSSQPKTSDAKSNVVKPARKFPMRYVVLIIIGVGIGLLLSFLFSKDGFTIFPQAGGTLKTDGKEKVAVADLIDEAVFTLSATADGLAYDLYVVQENVVETEDLEAIYADYGDLLETSEVVFYLAKQGGKSAYRQSQIAPFEMVRNLTSEEWSLHNWYEELAFPDYSLIAFYKYFDSFSFREIHLFDVIDGEVVKVNLDDFRYSWYYPLTKAIDEDKIQLVLLEESYEDRWFFDTYEYDRTTARMYFYNERTFDAFDVFEYPIAEIIFEYWEMYDDAYVPFMKEADKRIWDLKRIVENAEDGEFGDLKIAIGDSMSEVYFNNMAFDDIGIIGSMLGVMVEIYYDTFVVGFNPADPDFEVFEGDIDIEFDGLVTLLRIPGEYTTFTIEEVEETLGIPDTFVISSESLMGYDYYGYYMGEYTLVFVVDEYDDLIEVELIPWDLHDYLGL